MIVKAKSMNERPNASFQRRRWQAVKIGTAGGTARQTKIAPSPEAAPAASAAKQCWAANDSGERIRIHGVLSLQ